MRYLMILMLLQAGAPEPVHHEVEVPSIEFCLEQSKRLLAEKPQDHGAVALGVLCVKVAALPEPLES